MAQAFQFELVSPERLLLSAEVAEVVIPGTEGYLTALVGHAPLMTTVKPGIVSVKFADGKADSYVVFGGFADITPQGCTVLAESATHVDAIDHSDLARRFPPSAHDLAGHGHTGLTDRHGFSGKRASARFFFLEASLATGFHHACVKF